jgi:hypothetical protein
MRLECVLDAYHEPKRGPITTHLKGNIEALGLELSEEDIRKIKTGYDFDVGFPENLLGGGPNGVKCLEDVVISRRLGAMDFVEGPKPIKHVKASKETVKDYDQ